MSYLPVQSNDTLRHLSLPNAPETLCGKLVVSAPPVPYSRDISEQDYLNCDLCATLSGGDSILKQTQAGRKCPYCDKYGRDASGLPCLDCGGSRWLDEGEDEYADDLLGLDLDDLKGTKVAAPELCENGCGRSIAGLSVNVGNEHWCMGCASTPRPEKAIDLNQNRPYDQDEERKTASTEVEADGDEANSAWRRTKGDLTRAEKTQDPDTMLQAVQRARDTFEQHGYPDWWSRADRIEQDAHFIRQRQSKVATNWTRDGAPIEDGFTVMMTKEQAARTPFLDYNRVSVSEKRECPDCGKRHWLNRISSCTGCDGLKCSGCMETIQLDGFLGMCKKCAGADSDLSYETNYEDSFADADRYLTYIMQDDDTETDPFFLPNNSD